MANLFATKFFIQKTQIIIKNKSKIINASEYKKLIRLIEIALTRNEQFFTHAKRVFFEITDKDSSGETITHVNQISNLASTSPSPPYTIRIVAMIIRSESENNIIRTILHELEHFRDFTISKKIRINLASERLLARQSLHFAIAQVSAYRSKIDSAWLPITPALLKKQGAMVAKYRVKKTAWLAMRSLYGALFRDIQMEGLASFSAEKYKKTESEYIDLMSNAEHYAGSLFKIFYQKNANKLLDNLEKYKRILEIAPYEIGKSIVYEIIYHHFRTLDQLIRMSFIEFIQTHEALSARFGRQSLVSITSDRGILDYKRLLNEAKLLLKF